MRNLSSDTTSPLIIFPPFLRRKAQESLPLYREVIGIIDRLTLMLFGEFPREVGNPKRRNIYNVYQFEKFIVENNGIRDCFVSIYPKSGVVDKIFFDLDGKDSLRYAKKLFGYLQGNGYSTVIIASGKKGYHIHLLLKPSSYFNAKEILTKVTHSILFSAFGKDKKAWAHIDPHIIGDVRRLCRIPNTLRPPENRNWCVPLPSDRFLDMDEVEVANYIKKPHFSDYVPNGTRPKLTDFPMEEEDDDFIYEAFKTESKSYSPEFLKRHNEFLANILRPCLYNRIITEHPSHAVRVATTVDLLKVANLTVDQIVEIYSKLGWEDWDERITRQQIESCKKLKPYGCKKLRQLGIPTKGCCIG